MKEMMKFLDIVPEGFFTFLGYLVILFVILFKDKIWERIFIRNGKKTGKTTTFGHNPNLVTLDAKIDNIDDKLDDIVNILTKLTTVIDERLPRKK